MLYGFAYDDFILVYTAEFIKRKNHEFIVKNLVSLKKTIPSIKVIFCGRGKLLEEIKALAKNLEVDDVICFAGYRKDVNVLCGISDICVAPSFQEGLPLGVVEAIACGLPCVASKIRGQSDVIEEGKNGFLFELGDSETFQDKIKLLHDDKILADKIRKNNIEKSKQYSVEIAVKETAKIYEEILNKD